MRQVEQTSSIRKNPRSPSHLMMAHILHIPPGKPVKEHWRTGRMWAIIKCEGDLGKTNTAIEEITGKKTEYMRPPYGAWKKEMEENTGMIAVLWNVDPLDWNTDNETEIVNKVVTETEENDIILLHDCYLSSVKAALRIIDIMQAKGYEFVTVDELLLD